MASPTYSRDNPSARYRELQDIYRQVHATGIAAEGIRADDLFAGQSLYRHIQPIRELAHQTHARTILDYGSGKGLLYGQRDLILAGGTHVPTLKEYWGVDAIRCFDPGVPEFSQPPRGTFHGVICTDVLEHVPEDDIPWLLAELFKFADRFVYGNIASFPAAKTLPNGWNAHVTIRPPRWWSRRIREAALGWRGEVYAFNVRRRNRLPPLVRKLFGSPKMTATMIMPEGQSALGRKLALSVAPKPG